MSFASLFRSSRLASITYSHSSHSSSVSSVSSLSQSSLSQHDTHANNNNMINNNMINNNNTTVAVREMLNGHAITAPPSARAQGEWGIKRSLPTDTNHATIRVTHMDNTKYALYPATVNTTLHYNTPLFTSSSSSSSSSTNTNIDISHLSNAKKRLLLPHKMHTRSMQRNKLSEAASLASNARQASLPTAMTTLYESDAYRVHALKRWEHIVGYNRSTPDLQLHAARVESDVRSLSSNNNTSHERNEKNENSFKEKENTTTRLSLLTREEWKHKLNNNPTTITTQQQRQQQQHSSNTLPIPTTPHPPLYKTITPSSSSSTLSSTSSSPLPTPHQKIKARYLNKLTNGHAVSLIGTGLIAFLPSSSFQGPQSLHQSLYTSNNNNSNNNNSSSTTGGSMLLDVVVEYAGVDAYGRPDIVVGLEKGMRKHGGYNTNNTMANSWVPSGGMGIGMNMGMNMGNARRGSLSETVMHDRQQYSKGKKGVSGSVSGSGVNGKSEFADALADMRGDKK